MKQILRGSSSLVAALLLVSSAFAQTFPEVEPNSDKVSATLVNGIAAGGTITGTSTGAVVTAGDTSLTTADMYRVKTGALATGIYLHTLTLTSATGGNVGSIRGVTQTAGVPNPSSDVAMQANVNSANKWYGFGAQEEVYYRVTGTAASTAAYGATLSTSTVTPFAIPGLYNPGTVTITTAGQGHSTDTEIYVYDSTMTQVPGGHNDDNTTAGGLQSRVSLTLAAGTYFVSIGTFNTGNNQSDNNPGENYQIGNLMDFPGAMARSELYTTALNVGFSITDGATTTPVAGTLPGVFENVWATFTVQINTNPPANDNCANAQAIGNGTFGGILTFATNDGAASCDPGGAASRDVWYSFTDPTASGGTLNVDTCGTNGSDTALSIYAACGGTELACNDNCGGAPCAGTNSCATAVLSPGQTVKIRISEKGLGATGTYTLNVSFVGNPPINDLCTNALPIVQGITSFDTTLATSGQGTTGSCGSTPYKNLWYSYVAQTNGTLTVTTCGQSAGDTEIWIYAGAGCPSAPSVACNDDACGLQTTVTTATVCGTTYMLEVGNFSATTTVNITGTFTVSESGTQCSTPSTPFCEGSSVGTTCVACGNNGLAGRGCANSFFAQGGLLTSTGNASVGTDTLVLTASEITGPGLFFQANGLISPVTFGDGMLCAGTGIIRMGVVFPTAGVATYPGGLTPNPVHIAGGPINPGDIKHYQCWYRDAIVFCTSATFNTTQGVSLQWGP